MTDDPWEAYDWRDEYGEDTFYSPQIGPSIYDAVFTALMRQAHYCKSGDIIITRRTLRTFEADGYIELEVHRYEKTIRMTEEQLQELREASMDQMRGLWAGPTLDCGCMLTEKGGHKMYTCYDHWVKDAWFNPPWWLRLVNSLRMLYYNVWWKWTDFRVWWGRKRGR